MVKGESGTGSDVGAVVAVSDEGGDFYGELSKFCAKEYLVEAMVGLGDEDGGAHFVGQLSEVP